MVSNKEHINLYKGLQDKYGFPCKVCGKLLLRIGNTHLKLHGLTCKEYVERYGGPIDSYYLKERRRLYTAPKMSKNAFDRWNNKVFREKTTKHFKEVQSSPETKANHKRGALRSWKDDNNYKTWGKSLQMKPNKPEQKLIKFFKEHNLPYVFTGDGSTRINGLSPDFLNCNGQKKIIEHFGSKWHTKEGINKKLTEAQYEDGRRKRFAEFGFKMLIIWDYELKDMDKVLEKVKKFDGE
jgi:very-short-patch-repair endonuclease